MTTTQLSSSRPESARRRGRGATTRIALALVAIFALQGNYCGEVLDDPSFEMWCEDQLCSWEVEAGEVDKVPTWHERDFGVSLVGEQVAISQLSSRTSDDLDCLHFHLLANVAETAQVTLELDFYDDGVVDFQQIIPTSDWALLSYYITLPTHYQGIRFRIRKQGPGEAVLAEISAASSDECTLPPLVIDSRPDGADCSDPAQCDNGACELSPPDGLGREVCGGCTDDGDCGGGACGLESAVPRFLTPYRTCVAAGHHGLGEVCVSDSECTTGLCCGGACSTCCVAQDVGCVSGQVCQQRDPGGDLANWNPRPSQCDPEGGSTPSSSPCLSDSDCESGTCDGDSDLRLCALDGRVCGDDTDCPVDFMDFFAENGHCLTVGKEQGSCR